MSDADRVRLARVYGRDPDPALIAALRAESERRGAPEEPVEPAGPTEPAEPERGASAEPPRRRRRRGLLLVPLLAGALAVAAWGVGVVGGRGAPTTASPSTSAEPPPVVTRITVPGAPAGCRIEFFVTLAHPTPAGLAQLARLEAFVRTHDWSADAPAAGRDTSRLLQARRAEQVLSAGLDEFGTGRGDEDWGQRISRTSTSLFCAAPASPGG